MKGSMSDLTKAFAHSENPHGEWHELIDHLEGVAERAREFADALGAPEYGYLLGLWHDVGKFHPQFQEYLHGRIPRGGDHKGAGAVLAVQCLGPAAMVIQGHHGGLKALAEFQAWLRERSQDPAVILALASARSRMELRESVQKLPAPPHLKTKESSEFWIRLLFSALVDADFLDTEAHFRRITLPSASMTPPLPSCGSGSKPTKGRRYRPIRAARSTESGSRSTKRVSLLQNPTLGSSDLRYRPVVARRDQGWPLRFGMPYNTSCGK